MVLAILNSSAFLGYELGTVQLDVIGVCPKLIGFTRAYLVVDPITHVVSKGGSLAAPRERLLFTTQN